jgi:tetratricopeptide (TPR) repeat protein
MNNGKLSKQDIENDLIQILDKYPKSYVIHNILGAILAAENKLNEAITHHKKSIEIKFDYAEAHNNLGNIFNSVASFSGTIFDNRVGVTKLAKQLGIA